MLKNNYIFGLCCGIPIGAILLVLAMGFNAFHREWKCTASEDGKCAQYTTGVWQ